MISSKGIMRYRRLSKRSFGIYAFFKRGNTFRKPKSLFSNIVQ